MKPNLLLFLSGLLLFATCKKDDTKGPVTSLL